MHGVRKWVCGKIFVCMRLSHTIFKLEKELNINTPNQTGASAPVLYSSEYLAMAVPKGARSPIWKLVIIDPSNKDYAICKVNDCNLKIGCGGKKGISFAPQI